MIVAFSLFVVVKSKGDDNDDNDDDDDDNDNGDNDDYDGKEEDDDTDDDHDSDDDNDDDHNDDDNDKDESIWITNKHMIRKLKTVAQRWPNIRRHATHQTLTTTRVTRFWSHLVVVFSIAPSAFAG